MKKNPLKLDVTSPFYRVCPNPSCSSPFMTKWGRVYCCDKCADEHYNSYRKLKKMLSNKNLNELDDEDPLTIDLKPSVPTSVPTLPVVIQQNEEGLKKNIEIFSRLEIDKTDGSIYNIHYLESLGVDFTQHSYCYPLCNTKNSFCVLFGNYETFLINPTEILIYFKNK